jgi:hypothetical protein
MHHPGCDREECPRCGRQLFSCACNTQGLFADLVLNPALDYFASSPTVDPDQQVNVSASVSESGTVLCHLQIGREGKYASAYLTDAQLRTHVKHCAEFLNVGKKDTRKDARGLADVSRCRAGGDRPLERLGTGDSCRGESARPRVASGGNSAASRRRFLF